jgi:hypothetical protein
MNKDYFIKEAQLDGYTINAFVEAIVEVTKQGIELDFNSARRIGNSFCVNFKQEEDSVETQEAAASEAENIQPEAPVESTESVSEPEQDEGDSGNSLPTLEQIEDAKGSMKALNELAEPLGITGKSKKDVAEQLRALVQG